MNPGSIRFAGADCGGSFIRLALLARKSGRPFLRQFPVLSSQNPARALPALFKKLKVPKLDALVAGSRGVWTAAERRSLKKHLRPLARRVIVLSDLEIAYGARFGKTAGILVIAGTGSIAYGKDARGNRARAGGVAPLGGDPGSGYWIGREFLKRSGRKKRSGGNMSRIAAEADAVLRGAARGDALCLKIESEARRALVRLVTVLLGRLRFRRTLPLACAGGVFGNRRFKKLFLSELAKKLPGKKLKPARAGKSAEEFAAGLAARAADAALGGLDEFQKNLHLRRRAVL